MAALTEFLPPVRSTITSHYDNSNDTWFKLQFSTSGSERTATIIAQANLIPPYLERAGFIPRKAEDFGDGGAFPEIHVAQHPLGLGRRDGKHELVSMKLALTVDSHGNVAGPIPHPSYSVTCDTSITDDIELRIGHERVNEGERDSALKETREEREERRGKKIGRRESQRERRLDAKEAAMGKKYKIARDEERNVSEKVALGVATTGSWPGEVMYDQRLFNQEKGMDSGSVTDDQYNVYDKGLFTAQSIRSNLYNPKKYTDSDMYGGKDEQLDKVLTTDRFTPNRAFSGSCGRTSPIEKPVEFEKQVEGGDPFGLDQFLAEVRSHKKTMGRG